MRAKNGDKSKAIDFLKGRGGNTTEAIDAISELEQFDEKKIKIPEGAMYKVHLKPKDSEFLDWDKPLSEQSEKVKDVLLRWRKEKGRSFHNGQGAYREFEFEEGSNWAASKALHAEGIKGIRFLDGNSRGDGEGSYNYVIFDDKDITITHENGQAVDKGVSFSIDINHLSKPPSEYSYERESQASQILKDIENQRGIQIQRIESDARSEIVRFEESTGVKIHFYKGAPHGQIGFVDPGRPWEVYINAEGEVSLSVVLAHEWSHAADKDPDSGYAELEKKVFGLLSDREKGVLQKHLEGRDESYVGRWEDEVIPYFMGDAVSGKHFFGLKHFSMADEISAAVRGFYQSAGVLNPQGKAFNNPDADLATFSITADTVDPVIERVRALMRDPDTRLQIYGKMQKTLTEARRMVETEVYTPYGKQKRDAIVQPRSMTSLRREAADMRRKAIEDETNAIYETLGDILDDETLTSLKEQPVTSRITEEGGIESYTEATKRHGDDLLLGGEYDDLAGLPPLYWGGSTTPDIMAEMLHTQGLINEPTVTAMAEAIDGELATVSRNKEHLGKARARLKAVREKAGADSRAWLTDRLKEQQRDHNPRTVTLRSIASLEAVVRVLPAEVRGKVGGLRQIAKLSKPDAIANELLKRIETADRLLEKHLQKDYRRRINDVLDKSTNTIDKKTRRKKGKIGAISHEVADAAIKAKVMTPDEAVIELQGIRDTMADTDMEDVDEFFALDARQKSIELFHDFLNADSARLADAYDFILGNYKVGREEVLLTD